MQNVAPLEWKVLKQECPIMGCEEQVSTFVITVSLQLALFMGSISPS